MIEIDISPLLTLAEEPIYVIFWKLFLSFGWLLILFVFLWAGWQFWLLHIRKKYAQSIQYVLLSISVPKENKQGPEVTEKLFIQLTVAKSKIKKIEKYFKGYFPLSFSFELISIDGQIQFLVRTPTQYRDLVETAIYATYPDAEIFEVEDYTIKNVPEKFPDEEYDCWAADIVLYNKNPYPIRTYPSFEHSLSGELKDPLIPLLEVLGKLFKGEQIWLQIIITPIGSEWKSEGVKLIRKMMGLKVPTKKTFLEKITEAPLNFLSRISEEIWPTSSVSEKTPEEKLATLTPAEKRVIEAIQNKISKPAFAVKFRMVYLAKKEFFSKTRGVIGVLGALSQFSSLDMNGFKPHDTVKTTKSPIFGEKSLINKQNQLLKAYRERDIFFGAPLFILNVEELATIYHLPVSPKETILRVPSIKTIGSKKGEPPFGLPVV
jgi:hypothetical protein